MDDYKYLLSIIIPMYNTEKYIANCLDSILNSNLQSSIYEVIIINDGSFDNGPRIANEYAQRYEHIQYYTQNNKGLSSARNMGIDHASGKYIWFVDADDEITTQSQEIIKILNKTTDLDFLAIQLQKVDTYRNPLSIECSQTLLTKNVIMSGRDAIIKGYNPSSACALIMCHEFIESNRLRFKLGITHEDVEFTYRAMTKAQKVIFTNIIPYLYFRRGDTMSTPKDPEKLLKYIIDDVTVADSFRSLSFEFKQSDTRLHMKIQQRSQSIVFGLILQLYCNRKLWKPLGINRAVLEKLKECDLYPIHGPFDSWKKTLFSKMLNIESLLV